MARRPCAARNRKGEPCRAHPKPTSVYCQFHDPAAREAQERARELGRQRQQRNRALTQIYQLGDLTTPKGQLEFIRTLQMEGLPLVTSAQGLQALASIVRAFPRIYEQAVLAHRLEQLEAQDRRRAP